MEKLRLTLPAMYGDHHVLEVRRLLFEIPGVEDVYASSSFHVAEVTFDPAQTTADTITSHLEEAGYLDSLDMPIESKQAVYLSDGNAYFRHTAAYAQTGHRVSFAQYVNYGVRPLWPCPGMGPIRSMDEGE